MNEQRRNQIEKTTGLATGQSAVVSRAPCVKVGANQERRRSWPVARGSANVGPINHGWQSQSSPLKYSGPKWESIATTANTASSGRPMQIARIAIDAFIRPCPFRDRKRGHQRGSNTGHRAIALTSLARAFLAQLLRICRPGIACRSTTARQLPASPQWPEQMRSGSQGSLLLVSGLCSWV